MSVKISGRLTYVFTTLGEFSSALNTVNERSEIILISQNQDLLTLVAEYEELIS